MRVITRRDAPLSAPRLPGTVSSSLISRLANATLIHAGYSHSSWHTTRRRSAQQSSPRISTAAFQIALMPRFASSSVALALAAASLGVDVAPAISRQGRLYSNTIEILHFTKFRQNIFAPQPPDAMSAGQTRRGRRQRIFCFHQ